MTLPELTLVPLPTSLTFLDGDGVGVSATVVVDVNEVVGVVGAELEFLVMNLFFICPKRVEATLAFLKPASWATRFQSTW